MKSISKRSRSFDRRYSSTTLIEMTGGLEGADVRFGS
jgi:hypothetical protein